MAIRPIAVGVTLRHLASKCANIHARHCSLVWPSTARSSRHSRGLRGSRPLCARRYLQSLSPNHIMVKLDFANAFNNLHRSDMLLSVGDRYPSCMPFASLRTHSCHSCILDRMPFCPRRAQTILPNQYCQSRTAPFLFHHSSSHYFAELRPYVGNLDDLTLAGPQSVVAVDIQQVMAEGSKMGLRLNPSKCEVISHPDPNIVDQTMSSFTVVSVADTTLLGARCSRAKFWMTLG